MPKIRRANKKRSRSEGLFTEEPTPSEIDGARWLSILGAEHNNLKGIDVHFPLGRFIAVTGVSGSGKSSLVGDILRESLSRDLNGAQSEPGKHEAIEGLEHLDKVIDIDQSPIGRTPRSNPATYIKVFDQIRTLFAQLPAAKVRGYTPGRFSFNVSGGRCEACEGNGANKLEMDFLADVWVTCPVCEGHRFNRETLQIRFKDKNIQDVLEMEVGEAIAHFENIPKIRHMLQTLHDVGLDYLKLGQPSPTLSGGEAQRIKLAKELCRPATGRTLYVLDEPTTGLHFEDIRKLLAVLHGFVDAGNTVVVIEHNLDVIKTADWILDLGPEGGGQGGELVVAGTPEQVMACTASHTGKALRDFLMPKGKATSKRPLKRTGNSSSKGSKQATHIEVDGASQHNLKEVSAKIPLHQMTVFCGPSGSGKSSLAIDTLYAEGQRRYVESLSAYARQFLGQMQKPRVERVAGLAPAICIEQKSTSKSPRSTVGTVTEIYDYLRVLLARLGQPYCPSCEIPIGTQTSEEIIDKLLTLPDGTKVYLMAPIARPQIDNYASLWRELESTGFARMRVDGVTYEIADPPKIDRRRHHLVEVIVDRTIIRHNQRSRIADAVEAALDLGKGVMHVAHVDAETDETKWRIDRYNQHFACDRCGRSFEELTPNHFSFNSPIGWCKSCEGLGVQAGGSGMSLSQRPGMSLRQGAITAWPPMYDPENPFVGAIESVARNTGFSLDDPFEDFDPDHRRTLLQGTGEEWFDLPDLPGVRFQYKGIYPAITEASRTSWVYRQRLSDLVGEVPCATCKGSRLREDASAVRFRDRTIHAWCQLGLGEALTAFESLKLTKVDQQIAGELVREIRDRLRFLVDVGLHYLTLARPMPSLSGGEAQRIRLASQLGSGLTGVLYLLDEPTIGLHPRDNHLLLRALQKLRDLGNTLILVEHDREVIASADHLVDFGPGAGRLGGQIVAAGTPTGVSKSKSSLTGKYLSGREAIPVPTNRRPGNGLTLEVIGANHHNLRGIDVAFPLGMFIAVTGVSGSGKSSLINDILWSALARRLHRAQTVAGMHEEIRGIENIDKVINVDQQPIGNTPSSNPATYTGVFDQIRELYAKLPDAKIRGYAPGRFSFNKPGGRCEVCEGNGQVKIEMHFLPDVWIPCEACKGKRYTPETLAVQFKGKSIADVLEMTAAEALDLFQNVPSIRRWLQTLVDVGLDYMPLGQSAPTLSGGEAQRVKLAAELARPNTGKTLYLLDEPTTGLHFDDLRKLLGVLHRLVDLGNSVLVIEHNLDVIKTADWIVDVGPDSGQDGGQIVFSGTPEDLLDAYQLREAKGRSKKNAAATPAPSYPSHTAVALAPTIAEGPHEERAAFDVDAAMKADVNATDEIVTLGQDVRMPWEVDGPRWHSTDRISRNGTPCKWDGEALLWVVEQVQKLGVFAATNWNDRSCVEITAPRKSDGWFLHALTGEEWLLRLRFRPGKGAFKAELLDRQLGLLPLDQMTEIPRYGSDPRVKVRRLRDMFQQVELSVYRKDEIDTPAFREFLEKAVVSFAKSIDRQATDPNAAMPWNIDGPKWHFSNKGFPPGRGRKWEPAVLERVIASVESSSDNSEWDWNSRDSVKRRITGIGAAWARIMTKRTDLIEVHLVGPKGEFNLAAVERLGYQPRIKTDLANHDVVVLRFRNVKEVREKELVSFLTSHCKAYAATGAGD